MNVIKNIALVMIAGALMISCSTPVYVQTDESANLAKYKTYSWVQTRANQDDNRNITAFAEQNIHEAVKAELVKKGWLEEKENPDLLLSYDILVEKSTDQKSDPVYTQSFSRVYYNPYLRRWGTVYYPPQFLGYDSYEVPVREGTLTITMMDAATDKMVWQAWTTEQMDNKKFTDKEITKSIKNIFKKFDSALR
jgi:hypothetical protein